MPHDPDQILAILDACCDAFTFPMLDNGYVYLAASRLTAYYTKSDWALAIEIFGYSPRGGFPDIHVYTFASRLHSRNTRKKYVNEHAFELYLKNNPNNESRFFYPIDGNYQEENNDEFVSEESTYIQLRGNPVKLPAIADYAPHGIELQVFPRIQVFELCRFLADTRREDILGTSSERRINVLPEMSQILQLDDWHHPDLLNNEKPSTSLSFQQIAQALAFGDPSYYQPIESPNTHWSNWPTGGSL